MARRKSRPKIRGRGKPSRPVNLQRNGLKLFRLGNYDQAILDWEQALKQKPNPKITAALAEAYFRRGVKQRGREDLKTAVSLQPDSPIYRYHLGLAEHRDGDLGKAITAYRRVQKTDEEWAARVAYVLALAYQQQGKDPAQQELWSQLTPAQQAQFQRARRFEQKRTTNVAEDTAVWQGIAAYADGRYTDAQTLLPEALAHVATPEETAIAHYYAGCLAARQEEWTTAVSHWEKARADGFHSPALLANLGEIYHRLAEEAVQRRQYQQALNYGNSALALIGEGDNQLNQLLSHSYQQAGYQSAGAGNWSKALTQWELAEEQDKGNFRLSCNLALAYEQTDDYFEAAQRWREALRRRPRKADHPDAIGNEEVARMWIRTAVAYQKSQEYDEANQVMRQAVKWQPENLEMRMALVDGYVDNGRLLAAENELRRILERDENNIPALIRMGEVISHSDRWWQAGGAVGYWQKVLELDPDNETARQLLGEYYQDIGDRWASAWFSDYGEALSYYQQGLQYQPESAELLISIAECHFALDNPDEGETALNQVFAMPLTNPETLLKGVATLYMGDLPEKAVAMIPVYKQKFPRKTLPLYLTTAANCLINDRPDWAQPWIERAESEHPDDPIYFILGQTLMGTGAPVELIETYLQKAIDLNQARGHSYSFLGMLYATQGDLATARKHWKTAKRIAKKSKDTELLERIAEAEEMFSNPFNFLSRFMGELDFDDEDFYDEDFDDDSFFF